MGNYMGNYMVIICLNTNFHELTTNLSYNLFMDNYMGNYMVIIC